MALAGDSKQTRIQMKNVFIAAIIIVSTLSIIGSIVMITIGYLNPFGTVGLGILGGGCVLYFSALLFLCSGSIWVKNRYYADENDFREKWYPSSTEDTSLLKPALNATSPAINEAGCMNETERQSDNNMVPLCSVSTVYSSVYSTASTVPDRTTLCNWQGGDAEKAADCDVLSSSLTAMQHTDKLQEKLKLKRGSIEQIDSESTSECKMKDLDKRKIADLPIHHSNGKFVSDTPRQRNPVLMDIVGTTYSSPEEKQLINHHISAQRKEGNNPNTNSQIYGGNNVSDKYEWKARHELPKTYNQECKPALEKRKLHTGVKDSQVPDRRWCVISEGDSWINNPRAQGTASKVLNTVPAAISETERKHRSCENLHRINQERTDVPLKNILPNTWLAQSEKVQLSSQMTTSDNLHTKGNFMMKPGIRKGF